MRKLFQTLASSTSPYSLAAKFRKTRFVHFQDLLESAQQISLNILDLGGIEEFWVNQGMAGTNHKITILNLFPIRTHYANMTSIVGDARNLKDFESKSVDIVFSNSVIEHLGDFEDQKRMANEIKRVSKKYFVQTPSYYFPIEPHFLFPFFHWLPKYLRIFLIQHFSLGWYNKASSEQEAIDYVSEIRLLKKSELRSLFPDALIYSERFFGVTKSYIAIGY